MTPHARSRDVTTELDGGRGLGGHSREACVVIDLVVGKRELADGDEDRAQGSELYADDFVVHGRLRANVRDDVGQLAIRHALVIHGGHDGAVAVAQHAVAHRTVPVADVVVVRQTTLARREVHALHRSQRRVVDHDAAAQVASVTLAAAVPRVEQMLASRDRALQCDRVGITPLGEGSTFFIGEWKRDRNVDIRDRERPLHLRAGLVRSPAVENRSSQHQDPDDAAEPLQHPFHQPSRTRGRAYPIGYARAAVIARLALVFLVACGARTDLVADDPPRASDASLDAPLDAPTGCRGLPLTPTTLVEDATIEPKAVALRGETLFFGVIDERPLTEEQTGGIYRMPAAGGSHERLELSAPYYGNRSGLLVGADYIVYHQARATRTGAEAWAFAYPAIVVERDRREPRVLTTELEEGGGRASAMALLGDRVIFSRHRGAPDSENGNVGRYEIRGDEESTIIDRADVRAAVGAGRNVYLWLRDEGGEGVLLRVTATSDVIEVERYDDFGCCWPWAADSGALYWQRDGTIEARRIGEAPVTIAEVRTPPLTRAAVDDRYLYWSDDARIHYVDKEGGEVQTLLDGDTSYVEALTTDGCGVYYSVVNPPRVMVVAAP